MNNKPNEQGNMKTLDVASRLTDLNLDLHNISRALELVAVQVGDRCDQGDWFMSRLDSSLWVLCKELNNIQEQYEDLYLCLCQAGKSESITD